MNYGDCNCSDCLAAAKEQYANGSWRNAQAGDLASKNLASGHRQVAGENDEVFYRKKNTYTSSEGNIAANGRSQSSNNFNGGRTLRGGYDSTQGGRDCGPQYGGYYDRPFGFRPRWNGLY